MKINCLSCGHNINLEDSTYGDYEGAIKCYACGAILEVKLIEGCIKSVKLHSLAQTGGNAPAGKSRTIE